MNVNQIDVAVIGGGPAGLNAALVLGRSRRKVVLFDENLPRNRVTHASHGFLTRDGIPPAEFRRLALEELGCYPDVKHVDELVEKVEPFDHGFRIQSAQGSYAARKLLLATGLRDRLPAIEGLQDIYGRSAFTCPYCDGWELRDEPLAVIAQGDVGMHMAQVLTGWSRDVVLCTNGSVLSAEQVRQLADKGVSLRVERIVRLESTDGILQRIRFEQGADLPRRAAFVFTNPNQASPLPQMLGVRFTEDGSVEGDEMGRTGIDGLFVAGDAAHVRVNNLVIAAAGGVKAAIAINTDLLQGK